MRNPAPVRGRDDAGGRRGTGGGARTLEPNGGTMRAATLAGVLVGWVLLGATGACGQDWPQWRGPNRDNKVSGFAAPAAWPKALRQRWKATVGLGDASPALVGDRLYAFTRQKGSEVTWCLDAATGKAL